MIFSELRFWADETPRGAAVNMAIDELLLARCTAPLLRVYRWAEPSVSFGYFGKLGEIAPLWPGRALVRRWTGGGVVPHGEDFTYTLIAPRDHALAQQTASASYEGVHRVIAALLAEGGAPSSLAAEAAPRVSGACFENPAQFDVLADGRKVAGAAQRRTRAGLLHQGTVHGTPGQRGHLAAHLAGALASDVVKAGIPDQDFLAEAATLAGVKYGSREWMERW